MEIRGGRPVPLLPYTLIALYLTKCRVDCGFAALGIIQVILNAPFDSVNGEAISHFFGAVGEKINMLHKMGQMHLVT